MFAILDLQNVADAREKGSMLIGTPSQVATQVEEILDIGFDRLQLTFLGFLDTHGMALFGDEGVPQCR